MNKEIADKWIKELVTTKALQVKGKLVAYEGDRVGFCCLGVLALVCGSEVIDHDYTSSGLSLKAEASEEVLEEGFNARIVSGLKTKTGAFEDDYEGPLDLAALNDKGVPFKTIGEYYIARNWERL